MKKFKGLLFILLSIFILTGCSVITTPTNTTSNVQTNSNISISNLPAFSGSPYIEVNNNTPIFEDKYLTSTTSFEDYSELDSLGRCGVCFANISIDLMPTEDRESISSVYPTGWKYNGKNNNTKYNTSLVEGGYLYNRCHLIGFQLTGENANEKNLITGTRYMNVDGMLPFENKVAEYIKSTGNHVLYRVTPNFEGSNLVASGVQIDARSVEDNGEGVCFSVYCYNVQPGITIDYATGTNSAIE